MYCYFLQIDRGLNSLTIHWEVFPTRSNIALMYFFESIYAYKYIFMEITLFCKKRFYCLIYLLYLLWIAVILIRPTYLSQEFCRIYSTNLLFIFTSNAVSISYYLTPSIFNMLDCLLASTIHMIKQTWIKGPD